MINSLFSQRNGYSTLDNLFIREQINPEIENAIINCYDVFKEQLRLNNYYAIDIYGDMEAFLWRYFLNQRIADYVGSYRAVLTNFVANKNNPWFRKLDIVEASLNYLYENTQDYLIIKQLTDKLVDAINSEFKRLNFAYRIIDGKVVEITSEEEIEALKEVLDNNPDGVREHLQKAIDHCSRRPNGDFRNSIKESISAVEVVCRKKTGANTLGEALKSLEKKGIAIPQMLKVAFEKLYAYTNNEETGIRHGLMDSDGTYTPGADEAIFMLVSCSAFINYLNKK